MPQTQISCPRCRQMITAQIEQLFDVTSDPDSKQRLLGGVSNRARCPYCGYEGFLATPTVYHDADKELLLTYFPSELGLSVTEQEKLIGPLINQVVNRLPSERRKAYLLRPQSFLTMQSMLERILQADGITPEMLDAQQNRLNLVQRLLQASSPEVRSELINQNGDLMDEAFFTLLGQLMEASIAAGQQPTVQALSTLEQQLMEETEFGQRLHGQVQEIEAAVKTLQEAGQGLTREKLVDLIIEAPSDERRRALVGLTRGGLDYSFFQALTERIDQSSGEERSRLESIRSRILEYINELDHALEEQIKSAQAFLKDLLEQEDIAKAAEQNLGRFDETTIQVLNQLIREAQNRNDINEMGRLQQLVEVLQKASSPPELDLIQQLIDHDPAEFDAALEEHANEITPQFLEVLGSLATQLEARPTEGGKQEDKLMAERVQSLYRTALRRSMTKNME
jgi:predicted Zn-dependent protease with MMP-like domain